MLCRTISQLEEQRDECSATIRSLLARIRELEAAITEAARRQHQLHMDNTVSRCGIFSTCCVENLFYNFEKFFVYFNICLNRNRERYIEYYCVLIPEEKLWPFSV